jgi:hypothetical protein
VLLRNDNITYRQNSRGGGGDTPGKISENENRLLAELPIVIDRNSGHLNSNFWDDVSKWFNDNLGLRSELMNLYTRINVNVLGKSSGEKVLRGRDGFWFYRQDNNIEIADPDYKISDEQLELVAARQQELYDYYMAQGVKYLFVIDPSKVSIYPEKLPYGDYTSDYKSHSQVLAEYLRDNTSVNAVATREAVLRGKADGYQVFLKTDTHWTGIGGYYGYTAIAKALGFEPVILTGTKEYSSKGEFSAMLGDKEILPPETVLQSILPNKYTDYSANHPESWNDYYIEFDRIEKENGYQNAWEAYENPDALDGTILCYADSMLNSWIMQGLSAHYKRVIRLTMRNYNAVDKAIEEYVQPSVVIFSTVERFCDHGAERVRLNQ